jgi:hypothetical protein
MRKAAVTSYADVAVSAAARLAATVRLQRFMKQALGACQAQTPEVVVAAAGDRPTAGVPQQLVGSGPQQAVCSASRAVR